MHRIVSIKFFVLSVFFTVMFFPCVTNAEDTGFLWLVNRDNPLCEKFRPNDLVSYRGVELREPARDAFIELLAAMEADGIHGLRLQSAYRSHSYQCAILREKQRSLIAKGKSPSVAAAIAAKSIQLPGASEHQLGLALDVSINGQLSQSFAETPAGIWLAENCHKFGFIIRYPRAKTDVTDIIYEPWHLRYVSRPHAQIMKETALTLEEYHVYLSQISMYLVHEENSYFLVSHTTTAPEPSKHLVAFSTTHPGEDPSFILTLKKIQLAVYPTLVP